MALVSRSSGLPVALSAPRHGDFPRSISGSKLPVCSLRGHAFPALWKLSGEIWWNATSKKQSVQLQRHREDNVRTILPPNDQSSHHAGSHKCVLRFLVSLAVSVGLSCLSTHQEKSVWNVPLPNTCWRGHRNSEPRSVGVLANTHGMTLLLQRTETPEPQLHLCFADGSSVAVFRSPSGTLCPKARGLSPQHIWEQAPCVFTAWPCFSCPLKTLRWNMVKCNLQETICTAPTSLWGQCQNNPANKMTNLAIMRAATSASCFSSWVLHCLLVCLAYRRIKKNLFETCLCQTPVGRGHRKSEPRSVGVLANTHGMTLLLQRTETPEPQLHMCFADGSSVAVFRSPSGTLCPKARGLSPQRIWEQAPCVFTAWPCFSCPLKSVRWNMVKCSFQETICTKLQRHCEDNVRTILPPMTNLAIMRAATSAPCFSSCVLHCLLVCLAYRRIKKNLFETCLCQTPVGRGHRKSEPRSVGVLANTHGMTLLLQRTETPEPQLHLCFADGSSVAVFRSPSGTLCPKARGLSPQHIWEQAPCVFTAWPCFSCPLKTLRWNMVKCNFQETICTKLQRHCEDNVRTILPPMTNLAIMRAATSASCFSSCVLHCLLVCLAYRRIKKNLFETCLCQTPVGRGHRRSEPRSVGVLANTHGMTLLLQRTETPEPQLHLCFADGSSVAVFRSPSGTLCPKARGLSPQHIWEQAPCVFTAWPCFSCPLKTLRWNMVKCNLQETICTAPTSLWGQCQNNPATNDQSSHHAGSHKCVLLFLVCLALSVGLSCLSTHQEKSVWNVPLPNTCWKRA